MADTTATGIVLAGGKSTRMGRDKASEPLLGRTLLQRAVDALAGLVGEIVVVRASEQTLPEMAASIAVLVVEDAYPDTGPLGGIYTGLSAMRSDYGLVVACDMPLLQPALLAELLRLAPGQTAVVPLNDDGQPEPLCAVYSRDCLDAVRAQLDAGVLKVASFFDRVAPLYVRPDIWRRFDAQGLSFLNVNRESDLARAEEILRA